MTELSKYNNLNTQLEASTGLFVGRIEKSNLNSITVNITATNNCLVTVYQFPTSQGPLGRYSNSYIQNITVATPVSFQCPIVDEWCCVVVNNTSSSPNNVILNTYFQNQNATSLIQALQTL